MTSQILYLIEFLIAYRILPIKQIASSPQPHITKKQRILKNAANNIIFLIDRKINDSRFIVLGVHLDGINLLKFLIEYSNAQSLRLDHVIILGLIQIDYFLYCALAVQIVDFCYPVLVRYFRVCWWDYLVLFECFVLVFWLLHHSDVLYYVLCELWPLQVTIPIYIDRLEKFYQIRYKKIFRHLVIWNVQFFNQVNKCR